MLDKLRESDLEMEPEHDITDFLGVLIQQHENHGIMEMTQQGLISQVI